MCSEGRWCCYQSLASRSSFLIYFHNKNHKGVYKSSFPRECQREKDFSYCSIQNHAISFNASTSTSSSSLVRILHHHHCSGLITEMSCLALRIAGIGIGDRTETTTLSQIRCGILLFDCLSTVLVVLFFVHIYHRRGGVTANEAVPDIFLVVVVVVIRLCSLGLDCSSLTIDDVILVVVVAGGLSLNDLLCVSSSFARWHFS